ncbi:hypothetical protein SPURM210S_03910 [Streptomyces purpurascens]
MGRTLREATAPLLEWSIMHLTHIDAARAVYDARADTSPDARACSPIGRYGSMSLPS